jgi:hypothetical protein
MTELFDRMIRAAKLEVELYEEVEADTSCMNQAMVVVILASLAGGLGFVGERGLMGLVFGSVAALLGWIIWAFLTYVIGTKLLPVEQTESDMGELLRTIGFASSPGVLKVFAVFPFFGPLIRLGTSIWMLAAMIVGVRQALDYESTGRAVAVCVIGWIVQAAIIGVLINLR